KAANAPAIDLDISNFAEIDQVLSHMTTMRSFAAGGAHRLHALAQPRIGQVGRAVKRFFEKGDAIPLHGIEPGGGGIDILAKNLTGINQQYAIRPKPFA